MTLRQGQPGVSAAAPSGAAVATASTRTGMPFRCAMPASRSRPAGSDGASRFTFTPPASFASRQPPRCPQPCGSATVPGVISSVTSTGTSTEPDSEVSARNVAIPEAGRRGVVGMDPQRLRAPAAHQQGRVVHPGVVRAQLAQADQPQRKVRRRAVRRTPAGRSRRARPRRRRARDCRSGARGSPSTPVAMWSSSTTPCGERATFAATGRSGADRTSRRPGPCAAPASIRRRGDTRSPSRASMRSGRSE